MNVSQASSQMCEGIPDYNKPYLLGRSLDFLRGGLTDSDFERISRLIYEKAGIELEPQKKSMIEVRLRKRILRLQLDSFDDYVEYLFSGEGMRTELVKMVDVITTNTTHFFREMPHFDFLQKRVLPELALKKGIGFDGRPLRVWSAGCSTGEEPYTLGMLLSEFADKNPGFDFSIVGTDISTVVLDTAKQAIYEEDKIATIPQSFKQKYLLRSRNKNEGKVRISPALRSKVRFERLNFMDADFGFRAPFDIIFCRNVIIYFDIPTQQRLLGKFMNYLDAGSYLFMGHSETLYGMGLPLTHLAPATYQRYQEESLNLSA